MTPARVIPGLRLWNRLMAFLFNFSAEQKKIAYGELTSRGLHLLFNKLLSMYPTATNPEIAHRAALLLVQFYWVIGKRELPPESEEVILPDAGLHSSLIKERKLELVSELQSDTPVRVITAGNIRC